MKYLTAYYLMLLYATVMFRPLMPVVADLLSHTFAEAIHEATIHAVYGAHHLQAEIATAGSENDNNKHSNNLKTEDPVPVHISCEEGNYPAFENLSTRVYACLNDNKFFSGFISNPSPPPEFG